MLTFLPQSAPAQDISTLFIITLAIAAVIFLIVTGLVLYASFRFRERQPGGDGPLIYGNRALEITWTAIPAVILIFLFAMTVHTMSTADPSTDSSQTPDLIITGSQWWWEVQYPKLGVTTANEFYLPVGTRLLVEIRSDDVIHSFWVPQLGRKMDATPGYPTRLWLQADQVGTFQGECAEYCGTQHAWMRILAVVQSQADFNAWIKQQQGVPAPPAGGQAAQGAQLFQQMTCMNCHTIAGTSASGTAGPNLTHVASRLTLGGGVLQNTPTNLAAWISDPEAFKPGSLMPDLHLNQDQVNAIVAYLEGNR